MNTAVNTNIPNNMEVVADAPQATRGEKAFDWLTYKGVNFVFNELLSLGITDLFLGGTDRKDGKATSYFANKYNFTETSDKLYQTQNWLNSKFGKTAGAIFTLNLGGHITAAMVKLMENKRPNISRKFDNIIDNFTGTKKTQEIINAREERYEFIKSNHAKSWGQIVTGRLGGMVASMAINGIPDLIDKKVLKLEESKEGFRGFRRLTGWGGKKLETPIIKLMEKRNGGKEVSEMAKKRAAYWSEMVLLETWCTKITAVAMETIVKWGDKRKENKERKAPNNEHLIANNTTNSSAPIDNRDQKSLKLDSSNSKFIDEEDQEHRTDKKRWVEKGTDIEDEVGITI